MIGIKENRDRWTAISMYTTNAEQQHRNHIIGECVGELMDGWSDGWEGKGIWC